MQLKSICVQLTPGSYTIIGVKYYVVHVLHSTMECIYYAYGSTANWDLERLYVYTKERHCYNDLCGVGNF